MERAAERAWGAPAVLGVERSIRGKAWRPRLEDERAALALAQRLDMPEIVGRVLAARGVDLGSAEAFLNPTIRESLPDPLSLKDMDAAVVRLVRAIETGESIAIFGDYDVDGATSTALLVRYLRAIGRDALVYVPDRISEGYGPNGPALRSLAEQGAKVVVTVDCGITAHQALEEGAAAGLDIIVLDHHVAGPALPPAAAVVNPNRLDEENAPGQLAAVGVTFLLVVALNRALRDAFWFGEGHAEPNLLGWLDLVALGTICDVVPLTGINRTLVTQGLKVMARRGNPGLRALADIARIDSAPGVYHAGFVFGPRVNAGGRVGESGLGVRLLVSEDEAEAGTLAARLDDYNRQRQEIEAAVLDEALALAEAEIKAGAPVVVVAGEGWHPGVIGIVASRIKERFDRPACVVALQDGTGKGSGRSVRGAALGPAVIAARQAGIVDAGGGHAMAAGFTLAQARLDEFKEFMAARLAPELADTTPSLGIDGALAPGGATLELIELLQAAGPFGAGNPRPRFALMGARIIKPDYVGKGHVRCFITGSDGTARIKGIAFRAADSALGPALIGTSGRPLHLAGHLEIDSWQGRQSVQMVIEDAAAIDAA